MIAGWRGKVLKGQTLSSSEYSTDSFMTRKKSLTGGLFESPAVALHESKTVGYKMFYSYKLYTGLEIYFGVTLYPVPDPGLQIIPTDIW